MNLKNVSYNIRNISIYIYSQKISRVSECFVKLLCKSRDRKSSNFPSIALTILGKVSSGTLLKDTVCMEGDGISYFLDDGRRKNSRNDQRKLLDCPAFLAFGRLT